MKAPTPPGKRRWRGPGAVVLALVFCSLLVPIAFLYGRFPAVYVIDEQLQQEIRFRSYDRLEGVKELQEDLMDNNVLQAGGDRNKKTDNGSIGNIATSNPKPKVLPTPKIAVPKSLPALNTWNNGKHSKRTHSNGVNGDEAEKACQLEFGSYCLWSIEHKEEMKDFIVKRLKDQLFGARAYYPSIAKLQGQEALTHELKQNIQDHERVLSEAIVDADLPSIIGKKIERMEQTITRAKSVAVDCTNVDRKLRQILDLTKDETHFHMKQSAFLYQLGVNTIPKSLQCLSMRLTVEYFGSPPSDFEHLHAHKFDIPRYRHFIIFSKNILAASVVINSTVMSSEVTGNMVFHLLTDAQNFYAMKLWFARNSYREAALRVVNYEDLVLQNLHNVGQQKLYLPEEFHVSVKMRIEYLSVFSHSHLFLPEIFKKLKRVIVLDDDMVVQRDLSSLWDLDLGEKVNGAANFCGLRLSQLGKYLGNNIYDPKTCAWMSGLNVIDLEKWREHNITTRYLQLLQKWQSKNATSLRTAALPLSMLAFQNLIYPLDERWVLSGLGYDYGIDMNAATNAASLHYNGNMKPWLELGIPEYKDHWKKFLNRERFMDECNVHL